MIYSQYCITIWQQYWYLYFELNTPVLNWCSLRDIHLIAVFTVWWKKSVLRRICVVLTNWLTLLRFVFRVLRNWAIVSENVFKRLRKTVIHYFIVVLQQHVLYEWPRVQREREISEIFSCLRAIDQHVLLVSHSKRSTCSSVLNCLPFDRTARDQALINNSQPPCHRQTMNTVHPRWQVECYLAAIVLKKHR